MSHLVHGNNARDDNHTIVLHIVVLLWWTRAISARNAHAYYHFSADSCRRPAELRKIPRARVEHLLLRPVLFLLAAVYNTAPFTVYGVFIIISRGVCLVIDFFCVLFSIPFPFKSVIVMIFFHPHRPRNTRATHSLIVVIYYCRWRISRGEKKITTLKSFTKKNHGTFWSNHSAETTRFDKANKYFHLIFPPTSPPPPECIGF